METEAKYLIITAHGIETPIIFPSWIDHSHMAASFGGKRVVVSAGQVKVAEGNVDVYGSSTSLEVRSRPEDEDIIRHLLNMELS